MSKLTPGHPLRTVCTADGPAPYSSITSILLTALAVATGDLARQRAGEAKRFRLSSLLALWSWPRDASGPMSLVGRAASRHSE